MKRYKLLTLAVLCAGLLLCGCDSAEKQTDESSTADVAEKATLFYTNGLVYENLYDAQGRVTERICTDEAGNTVQRVLFTYGKDGTYIKECDNEYKVISESFCTPEKGTVYTHIYGKDGEFRYSYENGVICEKTEYKDEKPILSTVYDSNGRQTKSVSYTPAGEVLDYRVYSYNDLGKNTQVDVYDGKDVLKYSVVYEYTKEGYYASVTTKNCDGVIISLSKYEYDENNKQTAELVYKYKDGVAVSYEKWVTDKDGKRVLEGSYDV